MPLSENEQRILQEIERSFYETDPDFARTVTENAFSHASRNCKLAAVGFLVSLTLLLVTFAQQPVVAFVGFLLMVTCVAVFTKNLRRAVRPGFRDRFRDEDREAAIRELKDRLRGRFHRE